MTDTTTSKRHNHYTYDGFDKKQIEPLDPFKLLFAVIAFSAIAFAALRGLLGA